jgi:hypothetical protein
MKLYCIRFDTNGDHNAHRLASIILGRDASRKRFVREMSRNKCFCRSDLVSAVSFVPPGTKTDEVSNNLLELDKKFEKINLIFAIYGIFVMLLV